MRSIHLFILRRAKTAIDCKSVNTKGNENKNKLWTKTWTIVKRATTAPALSPTEGNGSLFIRFNNY